MPTLIKVFLLFIVFLSPLPAQESNLRRLPLQETYADSRSVLYQIVNLPESEWFSPQENISEDPGQDLWLKIPLETVQFKTDFYLTEHKGLRFWEFFLMKGDSLVHNAQVDWTQPHQDSSYQAILYRGFTYAPVTQYAGEGYVLFIHIRRQYQSQYNFILRRYDNFIKNQQTWSLIQGLGLGYFFVILLLSILLIINMKYLINWLFLLLVLFSGLHILFLSGLGPYITLLVHPGISQLFWYTLIGLFYPAVILYLQSFLELSVEKKGIRYYFKYLLYFTIALSLVPLFVPSHQVYFFVTLQSIFSSLLIGIGLVWLTLIKIRPARWLLSGWFLYVFVNTLGYILSQMDNSRTIISPVCSFLGQGFLVMLFGGAMIMDINDKRKKEMDLRITAESTAQDAIERMSSSERMADLGRLVASVTHELGTPLGVGVTLSTSLVSASKKINDLFVRDELSEDEFKGFLSDTMESSELIYRNMEQARTLIDGFKQVASDQAVPDVRTINLNEYLEMLLKSLKPGIRKTGNSIELSLSNDLVITSIPGILSQVLTNLINNALIHGLEGISGGVITVEGHRKNKSIFLRVGDTGKGIPSNIQDKIFDVYFTTRKGSGGTGVGLAIARSLVKEKLKGTIFLESSPGKGSVFTVVLPESISES